MLEAVGEAIAAGRYEPGRRLTLDELQREFGVSRTVARDTMRALETMNLVTSRRRVGIVVQDPARWKSFGDWMASRGLIPASLNVSAAFTTKLLPMPAGTPAASPVSGG